MNGSTAGYLWHKRPKEFGASFYLPLYVYFLKSGNFPAQSYEGGRDDFDNCFIAFCFMHNFHYVPSRYWKDG